MPTIPDGEGFVQKLTNETKSSPRKRKQEPDDDLAISLTPSKAAKRVKAEAVGSLNGSPRTPNRSGLKGQNIASKGQISESDFKPPEEPVPAAIKKTSKTISTVDINGHIDLDEATASTSVKQSKRRKVKFEVTGSTAADIKDEPATTSKKEIKPVKNAANIVELEETGQGLTQVASGTPPLQSKTRRDQIKAAKEAEATSPEVKKDPRTSPKKKAKDKIKVTETVVLEEDEQGNAEAPKKIRRKRKTKEEKEAEAMPLAARTAGLKTFIGAHVSIATGVEKAVTNCVHIGGNAFALFLQSQRKWDNKPLLDENRLAFMSKCQEHKYSAKDHVLPHGSYLVNLAQEEEDRAKKAYDHFLEDLKRCEALGIRMYNFHPGAAGKALRSEAISRISAQLNRALAETQTAIPVLENMCGSGSVIGSRFSDLRDIILGIKPEYKSRIGVCIDTCHAFAGGYDLRTPTAFAQTMQEFDDVVGMQYLKGLHINDSKAPFGSHRDLHQNIGLGFLGLRAFHNVMNEPRFHNMPLILETPCDRIDPSDPTGKKTIDDKNVWAREIKLLESLIGMDPEGDEFKKLEQELSEKGRASREKMQNAIDARNEKAKKKLEKGQRNLVDMMSKKQESRDSSVLSDLSDLSEGELDE